MSSPTPDWRLPTLRRPRLESAPSGPSRGPLGAKKAVFAPTLQISGPLGAPLPTLCPPFVRPFVHPFVTTPLPPLHCPDSTAPCFCISPIINNFQFCLGENTPKQKQNILALNHLQNGPLRYEENRGRESGSNPGMVKVVEEKVTNRKGFEGVFL